MVYVSISWSLASDHRLSVQSVPLGLFCPESKAQGYLWLGRSREGDWCLLSLLVVDFSERVDEVVIDAVWDEETGLECHQACEKDWAAVCCLQTLHLNHSRAELWPRFLRYALQGPRAPREPAWNPAWGHWGPRPSYLLPWRGCGPCGWAWGWVPRGLHLKWRNSFFCFLFFFFLNCE